VPVADIGRFEDEFLQYLRHAPGSPVEQVAETGDLTQETEDSLLENLESFMDSFTTSDGTILGKEAEAEAMDQAEVKQEKLRVPRRPSA